MKDIIVGYASTSNEHPFIKKVVNVLQECGTEKWNTLYKLDKNYKQFWELSIVSYFKFSKELTNILFIKSQISMQKFFFPNFCHTDFFDRNYVFTAFF